MRFALLMAGLLFAGTVFADPVEYSLKDLSGKTHHLSDYRGKWVVVNYWATWCPPCLKEIPDLVEFHERHKDKGDVVMLGVNFEDISQEQLADFVEGQMISYPVLREQPAPGTPLGPVPGLPTTYIVSPEGRPIARQVGPVTGEMLDDFIAKKQKAAAKAE